MIKIENVKVDNITRAVYSARNAWNSWDKSDSDLNSETLGENDLTLAKKLIRAGSDHRKFLRTISATIDITSHHAFWMEFDTYKVATVKNSCSKMHTIQLKEFLPEDFSREGIEECGGYTKEIFELYICELERLRLLYNETNKTKYWRAIIEMLPLGYNLKATVYLNYETLYSMYKARKGHKLDEWKNFCVELEKLPYFKEFFIEGEN